MKITPEVAQALVNLRGNTDFQPFISWLEECLEKEREVCEGAVGLKLKRAQGSASTLRTILKSYAEAPETLKKFQRNQSSQR